MSIYTEEAERRSKAIWRCNGNGLAQDFPPCPAHQSMTQVEAEAHYESTDHDCEPVKPECKHDKGFRYAGTIPCTGPKVCRKCGERWEEIGEEICWTCQRWNGIQPLDLTECRAHNHEIGAKS